MKERITPKDDIEIYNAVTNENTDKTQVLKWALCGKDYEDLEEQGLIVRLPCKVGDKLYCINTFRPTPIIEIFIISKIEITGNYAKYIILEDYKGNRFFSEYIGKTYFLTRSEAEKKLKELKGEE